MVRYYLTKDEFCDKIDDFYDTLKGKFLNTPSNKKAKNFYLTTLALEMMDLCIQNTSGNFETLLSQKYGIGVYSL